ncbi:MULTISPECIES: acetyltransferase [unclassified Polaromonas]|uniref:acetyltransferase n=1 Tax=unclassified Polaromonas TaxID=2638319 RepID=UPI000F077630|nr:MULTISPECIES: acetyltransferase [unclassified Polaromonas]AYQ27188.1 acetyltransferase [Polaromonas sp. SP1]QGJ17969.1 acetyltransferase [Polaromonas sp. Pch-P]
MKPLLLIGGGGHCRSCIDVIEAQGLYTVAGVVDLKETDAADRLGYPWLGRDGDLPDLLKKYPSALVTVGQVKSPDIRIALFEKLQALGADLPTIVSPLAHVSRHAVVQPGTIVMHGAIINAGARVGANCIINSQALVEHDSVVAAHCHISTGAKLNGDVHIDTGSFIGSGAVVYHGVQIASRCVVGAGAIVAKNLTEGTIFRGTR